MNNINCCEDLLCFFNTNQLRLNKYDNKFFSNLILLLAKNQFITTNQQALFNKLLVKYKRQLRKHKIYNPELLQWKTEVIHSDVEFTEAHVTYVDNKLYLRVPFNRNFILDLMKAQRIKVINWDKTQKCYVADFSSYALKTIVETVPNYFVTHYSQELFYKLEEIKAYNKSIWDPTLVELNDNYYILACNESLLKILPLTKLDASPKTLHTLSRYGIKIDKLIYIDDKLLEFSSHFINHVELTDLHEYRDYCVKLGLTTIFCSDRIKRIKNFAEYVTQAFFGLNIIFEEKLDFKHYKVENAVYITYSDNALAKRYYSSKGIEKTICLVNSSPINIK